MLTSQARHAKPSRWLPGFFTVLLLFSCSGATCNRSFRNPFVTLGPPAPEILTPGASLDQVLVAVNQNASKVFSYQSNNASITVPGMPGIPLLRGNLAAMQPGKVRLQASTALTGPEVDLGANDELFWFWVKRNEPPALYFSRHDQFAGSAAQQLLPVEPQWLLDALGMMKFSPNDHHDGPFPHTSETVEIRSVMQTRGGQMTKSTILDSRRGWVLEQHVYDAQGGLVASTRAKAHRYYPAIGASLPQIIELRLPSAQLNLSIDVGDVQVNSLTDNPDLWTMPVMSGYPQIDLGASTPGSVTPMGAAGSRDWSTGASPAIVGLLPEHTLTPNLVVPPALPRQDFSPIPVQKPSVLPTVESAPVTQQLNPAGVALSPEAPQIY